GPAPLRSPQADAGPARGPVRHRRGRGSAGRRGRPPQGRPPQGRLPQGKPCPVVTPLRVLLALPAGGSSRGLALAPPRLVGSAKSADGPGVLTRPRDKGSLVGLAAPGPAQFG